MLFVKSLFNKYAKNLQHKPASVYSSIDDLPQWNWVQIHKTGNLAYIKKLDTYRKLDQDSSSTLEQIWLNIYDEYLEEFGLSKEYKELLEEYYLANGSFKGIGELLWRGEGQERPGPGSQDEFDPSKTRRRDYSYFLPDRKGNLFGIANARGVVILPLIPHFPPGARVPGIVLSQAEPVEVDGVNVAYILTAPNPPDFTPAERAFLNRTNSALWIAIETAMSTWVGNHPTMRFHRYRQPVA